MRHAKSIAVLSLLCLLGLDAAALARGGGRAGGRGGTPRAGGNRGGDARRQNQRRRQARQEQRERERRDNRAAIVAEARLLYAKRERAESWDDEAQERLARLLHRALGAAVE